MTLVLNNEEPILEEFRSVTQDLNVDNTTLLRFLRARDLEIKKAESMLRKSVEWREAHDVDSATKWQVPQDILKDFRIYFTGLDKNGFPVYFCNLGQWDGRKILGKGLKEEVVKYMYKTLELVMQKCKSLGISKFTIICDNDGLSLWKVAHWDSIETTIRVIKDFEANYPETLVDAFLINTPSVFWQAFKFVKPILAGNTLQKIHIYDSDSKKWQAALLEKIPSASLPIGFGGSCQTVDVHQ